MSSNDRRADLDRQVVRLIDWATGNGYEVGEVVTEVGSGLDGRRLKVGRILVGPFCDGGGCGTSGQARPVRGGQLEAALSAQGRRIVVIDEGETDDDLAGDMVEVMTWMCARLYGRRGARNRAMRAVTATRHETREKAGA